METTFKFPNREEYLKTLDSVLPTSYIKTREHGNGKTNYIPAAIKEAVADDIFYYWNVVDENYLIVDGQVICTAKILYMPNYPGAEEHYCTGSAARHLGQAKNSLEYNIPGAKVEAISNALQTLGNIFGRNVDRAISKTEKLPTNYTIRKHGTAEPEQEKQSN